MEIVLKRTHESRKKGQYSKDNKSQSLAIRMSMTHMGACYFCILGRFRIYGENRKQDLNQSEATVKFCVDSIRSGVGSWCWEFSVHLSRSALHTYAPALHPGGRLLSTASAWIPCPGLPDGFG